MQFARLCLSTVLCASLSGVTLAAEPATNAAPAMRGVTDFATISGVISIHVEPGAAEAELDGATVHMACSQILVVARKAGGDRVASANAVNGDTADTCAYSLKVPANTPLTVGITELTTTSLAYRPGSNGPATLNIGSQSSGAGAGKIAAGPGGGPHTAMSTQSYKDPEDATFTPGLMSLGATSRRLGTLGAHLKVGTTDRNVAAPAPGAHLTEPLNLNVAC